MAKVESLILDFFSFSPFQSQNSMEAGPKCLRRYPWQSSRWQNIPDSMSLETNNCRSVYIYHLSMIFPMSTVCFFAGSWLQRNSFDSAPRDNDTVYTYILINQCTKLLQFCSIEQPSWPDSLFLMYYFASHYISLHFIYISPVDLFIFNMCRGEHIAFCKIHISAVCVCRKNYQFCESTLCVNEYMRSEVHRHGQPTTVERGALFTHAQNCILCDQKF